MQTVQRYLLSNLVIGYISGYHGRNSKVYDRRLTLHRGVSNPVTFTFKNEDQKVWKIEEQKEAAERRAKKAEGAAVVVEKESAKDRFMSSMLAIKAQMDEQRASSDTGIK